MARIGAEEIGRYGIASKGTDRHEAELPRTAGADWREVERNRLERRGLAGTEWYSMKRREEE